MCVAAILVLYIFQLKTPTMAQFVLLFSALFQVEAKDQWKVRSTGSKTLRDKCMEEQALNLIASQS